MVTLSLSPGLPGSRYNGRHCSKSSRAWAWSPLARSTKRSRSAPGHARTTAGVRWRIRTDPRSGPAPPGGRAAPEPPRQREQPDRRLDLAVHQPGHRGPQIVVLGLQPVQPAQLPAVRQLGRGGLSERQEIGGVPVVGRAPVSAVAQPLQRVLPDGLQQLNRGSPVRASCRTRLLSTSEPSVSITGPGSAREAARPSLTAATARRWSARKHPRRANRACSAGASRPKLQSSVLRRVRCARAGRAHRPSAGSSRASIRARGPGRQQPDPGGG